MAHSVPAYAQPAEPTTGWKIYDALEFSSERKVVLLVEVGIPELQSSNART